MKRIDRQTVQRILDTADIVDVVSDFVELKKRGANYVGLCPFHNDRSPSFSVNRARGICKCFSCGEGGNPVNFVMKIRQCSFGEALRYLASKYNIEIHETELTDEELRQRQERDSLFATVEAAGAYFAAMRSTPEGREALHPLIGTRAIPDTLLDRCDIGYVPRWPAALTDAMASRGFSPETVAAAGLADLWHGMITVGVRNRYGRLTGFEAYMPDGRRAEAVMPDTAIHRREDAVAGLWQARGAIGRAGDALLLSDPIHMLWVARAGIENAIALPTPGLTDERIRSIRKLTSGVTLLLPSGSRAIFEAMREALPFLSSEISVRVATLPVKGMSLAEFVDTNDSDTVKTRFNEAATDMVIYKLGALRRAHDASARDAYRTLFDDLTVTIRAVRSPLLREAYINELSDVCGQPTDRLRRMLGI